MRPVFFVPLARVNQICPWKEGPNSTNRDSVNSFHRLIRRLETFGGRAMWGQTQLVCIIHPQRYRLLTEQQHQLPLKSTKMCVYRTNKYDKPCPLFSTYRFVSTEYNHHCNVESISEESEPTQLIENCMFYVKSPISWLWNFWHSPPVLSWINHPLLTRTINLACASANRVRYVYKSRWCIAGNHILIGRS